MSPPTINFYLHIPFAKAFSRQPRAPSSGVDHLLLTIDTPNTEITVRELF